MSPFLALTGPTAVGKTDLAIAIAERIGAEILSVDSRQIYRGLDIGTAKPTWRQLDRVPHHFIDERELTDPISAGTYATEAARRIDDILGRGNVPLAVGGSTLYLMALVHGIPDLPPVPDSVFAQVSDLAQTPEGRQTLYDELWAADPRAAATLDPSKSHRLIRWVSVLRTTGQPPSMAWHATNRPRHQFHVVVLDRPRPELYQRIEERVDAMLAAGLIEENRRLLTQGEDPTRPPLKTIGYQEPQAFIRGELEKAEMVYLLKRNSRRYAKRQLTWFRRYPEYQWLDAGSATVDSVLNSLQRGVENQ